MVDANAAIMLERLPEVIPEGELPGLLRMQRAEGIAVAKAEQGTVSRSRLRLEERVMDPRGRLVTVDILGDDIEVAADQHGHIFFQPSAHLLMQPIHPGQLVGELIAADRIAVRKIDIDDADAKDCGFQISRVTVRLITGERRADRLDGMARQNRDAVIGLLGYCHAFIAQVFEDRGRKLRPLQFLQQQYIGLATPSATR